MAAPDLPQHLIDQQRRVHAAWADVEAHRRAVHERRRAETPDEPGRPAWVARPLRPWTAEENAEHTRLMAAARQAQADLRTAIAEDGLGHGIEVVQELHKAARAEA